MKRMRIKMLEYFNSRKVGCETANDFSFDHNRLPAENEIEQIARSWEIVADLTKRIADSKLDPKIDSLDLISFSKNGLSGIKDGQYISYRFNFTVKADITSLRRLIKNLYDAYEINRIYAVRNLSLSRAVDQVNTIIAESEKINEETEFDMSKPKSVLPGTAAVPKTVPKPLAVPTAKSALPKTAVKTASPKAAVIKKKVLDPRDPGYARIIVGNINTIVAEFEVDYIVFQN
ncbi:MAG: hypothetical protein PHV59_11215, partial [Victivallales bacterium]|nr:hypothetical protein [Victivallales bacterium]